ncbi:thioredoxin family protein [Luminiphilus sp.]|nr:thioredoxin family protein [Luminiphilus sp.]MDB2440208.1 thioredoxin family protein [Luminiphilus sp.]MDB2691281.1 thioredoxin family protein [Luminiphilus sp.]MDB3900020.1 thioredoxin family protein [Luminiphilus sp.]
MKDQVIFRGWDGPLSRFKQSLCRPLFAYCAISLATALPALAEDYQFHVGDITRAHLFEAYPVFEAQYNIYEVGEMSSKVAPDLHVQVLFATWCHDSEREVPRLLKILETAGVESSAVELVALDFNKSEPKGRAALQDLEYTPTFVFSVAGKEIGRIVERPVGTLEVAIGSIMGQLR